MAGMIVLTEGNTTPMLAKTAAGLLRYRGDEVLALLDSENAGRDGGQLLEVDRSVPVVAHLDEAPAADTLVIGISPAGGRLPESWRGTILRALERGMLVVSGLHEFLGDDPEFASAASRRGGRLLDLRRNDCREVARHEGLENTGFRVLTVGQDVSCGKMVVSLELVGELRRRGRDAAFLATGQTGIVIAGSGVPLDRVVGDFMSGAVERLVLDHAHREILVVEGQGSLAHPSFSGVTLALLHGSAPEAMILCYEAGRPSVKGLPKIPLQPLDRLIRVYEEMADLVHPSRVVGVALNGRRLDARAAEIERRRVVSELGLPCCDVLRDGASELANAVERRRRELRR